MELQSSLVSVVMYHYVRDIQNSDHKRIKGLDVRQFIEQLSYFRKNYNVISVNDLIYYFDANESLPPKSVLLTFDDGYKDHFQFVFPLLMDFGFKGAFYIPAKTVEEHAVLDVNKIHFILACCSDISLILARIKMALIENKGALDEQDFDFYYRKYAIANRFDCKDIIFIKRMLQHALPEDLRSLILNSLFKEFVSKDEVAFSQEFYMSKSDLKLLLDADMHIGAHGYEHYWWGKLDPHQLNFEIDQSISFLESLGVNMNMWTACYPYGSYNDLALNLLTQKGCKLAFTTNAEEARLSLDDRLTLPRLDTNDFPPIKYLPA